MAEKRMLTKKVTDDENFINLSSSAQALYLHLSMSADDDGFTSQISVSMFKAHASVQDMEALLEKRYIYQFDNGVIVIKHWRMANALRKDRYTPTTFTEEMAMLDIKENGAYTWSTSGCQVVAVDKNRLDKNSLNKNIYCASADEVIDYLNEKIGSKYRHSESSRKGIIARLNEGFSVDDCKTVIDKKTAEWLHTDMEKYLNPETLFRPSKFEKYLNAPISKPKNVIIPQPDFISNQTEEDIPPWLRNDA